MSFFHSTLYHLRIYFRVGVAVFFNVLFPLLLFVLFGSLWGQKTPGYMVALITGVVAMNIASHGMMGVGKQIRIMYENQTLRYLHGLPISKSSYVGSYVLAMSLIALLSTWIISLAGGVLFMAWQPLSFYIHLTWASILGVFLFITAGFGLEFFGRLEEFKILYRHHKYVLLCDAFRIRYVFSL